jgi:heme/copper-type cytochrome/quinol oxidase subunit 3
MKKNFHITHVALGVLLFTPILASAQVNDAVDLIGLVIGWLGTIVPLLIGVIMVIIFWNMGQFILHAGDERERQKYKQFIIWSVIAMFLIISFWGVVYMIARSFFGDPGSPIYADPVYMNSRGEVVE